MFFPIGQFSLEDDDDRPTWPPAGSATMIVEDKCMALFTSATWQVALKVNNAAFAVSEEASVAHSQEFIRMWTRQAIRTMYMRLRQFGVDADAEYLKFGGKPDDLGSVRP